jgi:ribosome-interacting GTPase 1
MHQPPLAGILSQYRIHNCELLFKEDSTVDDLIDVIEGNRRYVKCLYVYNKVGGVGATQLPGWMGIRRLPRLFKY